MGYPFIAKFVPRFGTGINNGCNEDMEYPFIANVPEVSAKHHGLAMIADNLQAGDAFLPFIGKELRICVVCVILLTQYCVTYVYLFQVRKHVT
jgi:hypothetical protein